MEEKRVSRIVTAAELPEYGIDYCYQHLRRLEFRGEFPKRIYLSARKFGWLRSEIEQWIEERAAARGEPWEGR
jgi:hypothetical protein